MVNLTKVKKAMEQLAREKKEREINKGYSEILKNLEIKQLEV